MASDPILVTCEACANRGMVDGQRCAACNGQGHIRLTAPAGGEAPENTEEPAVKLDRLKIAELRSIAERAGLDTSGTRSDLIERIQAAPASEEPVTPPASEEPAAA
ncbi:MAG: SAP domain-containing protein [Chloroflexota bacterium]